MKRKDGLPYIWPSWLSKLIGGDNQCVWAAWVKARFWYKKRHDGDTSALANWKAEHAKLVRETAEALRKDGWTVSVEDQNAFNLPGSKVVMGGKPDIVAVKGQTVLIVDCKTGRWTDADFWQVVIYCKVVPKHMRALCEGREVIGRVQYRTEIREITANDVTMSWAKVGEYIDMIADDTSPTPVPSERECKFCDVDECQVRISQNVTVTTPQTDLF